MKTVSRFCHAFVVCICGFTVAAADPSPANRSQDVNQPAATARQVLDDVPRVGFYPDMRQHEPDRGPEDIIFPSCMRAVMQHLGNPEYDYVHFVGVTGAGFYFNWKDGWHAGNTAVYFMVPFDEHLKLFEYAFDSTGHPFELVGLKGNNAVDEAEAKRQIVASIDAGRPIVAHGVVGPAEPCIITGYDEGGDVLIGWSFFQYWPEPAEGLEFEPNGMFRKRGWYADTWDLFIPGQRGEPVDPEVVRRRSLEWAVKVARTKETWDGRTNNGLAAYDAWAEHLLRDEDITPENTIPEGSVSPPFDVHDDAVGHVAEARHYMSEYLKRMAEDEPQMRPHLLNAAACCSKIHDLMWDIWKCVGGNGRSPEHARRFADPDTRRRIAEIIREAKQQDVQAIEHIEKALAATKTTP